MDPLASALGESQITLQESKEYAALSGDADARVKLANTNSAITTFLLIVSRLLIISHLFNQTAR
jgi:hypothetical protein